MRKQLLALLSMIGLAGSSAPASGQVLKGSKEPDHKTESQIKASKLQQENKAAADQAAIKKLSKGNASDSAIKLDKAKKIRKAGEADAAEKPVKSSVKAGKHYDAGEVTMRKAGGEKGALGDGSVKPSTIGSATGGAGSGKVATHDVYIKGDKKVAETNAASGNHIKKGKNAAAEKNAVQLDLQKKAVPGTNPK